MKISCILTNLFEFNLNNISLALEKLYLFFEIKNSKLNRYFEFIRNSSWLMFNLLSFIIGFCQFATNKRPCHQNYDN